MNTPRGPGRPVGSSAQRIPAPAPVLGVIETLADSLSLVLVYPMVALLPLLIDLGYWSGVTISPESLLARFSGLRDVAQTLGMGEDIAPILAASMPSLLNGHREDVFAAWSTTELSPGSWQTALMTVVALVLASSVLAVLFRVPLALVVRHDQRSPSAFARAIGLAWVRLLGLVALMLGIAVLVASPLLVVTAFFLIVGINIAPLLVAGLSIPAIAAAVYLAFTPDAIVVSEVGPLRAIYLSFNVVRRNFWATIALLASVVLISEGLRVLWLSQVDTPIGLLIGVLGNAFVGTGLALAAMQFYSDRLRRWLPETDTQTGPTPAN